MTIKHLILSGGGPIGLVEYGALKYLTKQNIISYNNIESIYAVSIGAILGLIYILNLEWLWVDDFIIKRPWKKLFKISYTKLLYEKGIINKSVVINALEPLFLTKNIPLTLTLLEFYNLTKIEFNIYACNFTELEQKKFNHNNTPNVLLIDALYVSLTVPFVFAPLIIDNCFYLDGGIIIGCPINNCIAEKQCITSEILCFINDKTSPIDLSNAYHINNNNNNSNNNNNNNNNSNSNNNNNINFIKFYYLLFNKWLMKISNIENDIIVHIKNSINVALSCNGSNMKYWHYVLISDTERQYLINLGELQAKKFINNLDCSTDMFKVSTQVSTQVSSNLVDYKILYLLNIYFKFILYLFYIYFIVILYIFYKNIKI